MEWRGSAGHIPKCSLNLGTHLHIHRGGPSNISYIGMMQRVAVQAMVL